MTRPAIVTGAPARGGGDERFSLAIEYVIGRKHAEEALGFLAACGAELTAAADPEQGLRRVAQLSVPFLADWCAIDVELPGGRSVSTVEASVEADAAQFRELLPAGAPIAYTAASGVACARDGDALERARAHGIRSALSVPVEAQGQRLGSISIVRVRERRVTDIGAGTVALVEELARRVATALELAALRRRVADLEARA